MTQLDQTDRLAAPASTERDDMNRNMPFELSNLPGKGIPACIETGTGEPEPKAKSR